VIIRCRQSKAFCEQYKIELKVSDIEVDRDTCLQIILRESSEIKGGKDCDER
jgi:hypothetical protein